MNKIIFNICLSVILIMTTTSLQSNDSRPILIGIQPGITVEPFYEEGEFDINILPLIIETPLCSRVTIRFSPMINYHIGGEESGISDVGIFTIMPIFFNKTESEDAKPYGFYIGPVLGFGRNLINEHYTTTIAIEPGYLFEAEPSFTISLGLQLGASHFAYDNEPNKWLSHWGPKITFGWWF